MTSTLTRSPLQNTKDRSEYEHHDYYHKEATPDILLQVILVNLYPPEKNAFWEQQYFLKLDCSCLMP